MAVIEITIVRKIDKSDNDKASTIGMALNNGSYQEFKRVQEGLEKVLDQIVWDRGDKKEVSKKEDKPAKEQANI